MIRICLIAIFFPFVASAVSIGHDGKGQVLIFPVYSTEYLDTLVTIQNTTGQAKAVHVRFREGAAGATALEFNLYLNPRERWQAAITEGELRNEAGRGAFLVQPQPACTVPKIPPIENDLGVGFFPEGTDVIGDSQDRSRSGFIEVIEMGVLDPSLSTDGKIRCDELFSRFSSPDGIWREAPEQDVLAPSGGLAGHTWLIDVVEGQSYSVPAVALTDYSTQVQHSLHATDGTPNLGSGTSTDSLVLTDRGWLNLRWGTPVEAVAAVFMTTSADIALDTDPVVAAGTSIILTFPTSPLQVGEDTAVLPFTQARDSTGAAEDFWAEARTGSGRQALDLCHTAIDPSPPAGNVLGLLVSRWTTAELAIDSTPRPLLGMNRVLSGRGFDGVLEDPAPNQHVALSRDVSVRLLFDVKQEELPPCGYTTALVNLEHATTLAQVVGGPLDGSEVRLRGLPVLTTSLHRVANGALTVADGSLIQANYGVAFPASTRLMTEIESDR